MSKKILILFVILALTINFFSDLSVNFATAESANPLLKISTSKEGFHKITFEELVAKGFRTDVLNVKLSNKGQEVPFSIDNNALVFYAEKISSLNTSQNVYFLEQINSGDIGNAIINKADLSLMSPTLFSNSYLEKTHFEENKFYNFNLKNGIGRDHFFWSSFSYPKNFKFDFVLKNMDYSNPNSKIILKTIRFDTNKVSAYFDVYLNGRIIKENVLENQIYNNQFLEINFNTELLKAQNSLEIKLENSGNTLYLDNFDLYYPRNIILDSGQKYFTFNALNEAGFKIISGLRQNFDIFQVTSNTEITKIDEADVKIVEDGLLFASDNMNDRKYHLIFEDNYLIPDNISLIEQNNFYNNPLGADYIIISHPDLMEFTEDKSLKSGSDILRLKEYREFNDNFVVNVYTVTEIYNKYNFGIKDPQAIKSFLSDAYYNWQIKPKYLLLIGNTTFDPKNHLKTEIKDYIPTIYDYFPVKDFQNDTEYELPDDELFSDFVVENKNTTGEIITGRFPVINKDELHNIVEKIFVFESDFYADVVKKNVFNLSAQSPYVDLLEPTIKAYLPESYGYFKNSPEMFENSISAARADFIEKMNLGQMIVNYIGHGHIDSWNGIFYKAAYLDNNHVYSLKNTQYPILLSLNCFGGLYNTVNSSGIISSIAEKFLNVENGSVASIGFPGLAISPDAEQIEKFLYKFIFEEKDKYLGEVIQKIRKNIPPDSNKGNYLKTTNFTYFGDPALNLKAFYPENFAKPEWITHIADQEIIAGNSFAFKVEASDNYGNQINYFIENIPSDASFNEETGEFFWTPAVSQIDQTFEIIFKASNGIHEISQSAQFLVKAPLQLGKKILDLNFDEKEGLQNFFDISESKNNPKCYPNADFCPLSGIITLKS